VCPLHARRKGRLGVGGVIGIRFRHLGAAVAPLHARVVEDLLGGDELGAEVAVELAEDGGEGRENKGEEEGADDGTRFSPCMEQHHGGGEGGADEHKQTDDAVTPREDVGGTTIGDADEVVVMQHGPFDVLLEVGGRDRARQHTPRGHEGKLVAVRVLYA